jgi:HlyD family secretion protein
VLEGPRKEVRDQAAARLAEAEAALALATTRLGYATVTAPCDGVVLSKNVEPGEYVSPGTPVVTIGNIRKPWLRAYLEYPNQQRVRLGQTVGVTTDNVPDRTYQGTLSFISDEAEFTPKNVQTEKERVKLVYRIKIDIDNKDLSLKRGMPADAEIPASDAAK